MSAFVDRIAARIANDAPAPIPPPGRSAAVAVVIHDEPAGPRVLLMKRNERAHDPWSGHISLPGGGYELSDADLLACSIREAHEELGLALTRTGCLGNLAPTHPAMAGPKGIQVTPFVFVTEAPIEPVCGDEAAAAFWLPLELAASGKLDGTYTYPETQMQFPSWDYDGHQIWGLTLRILHDLLERSGATR